VIERMLPRVDLPEVLLEVHAWTGFLDEFTHVSGRRYAPAWPTSPTSGFGGPTRPPTTGRWPR